MRFKSIRFKNFLSFGNKFTELKLDGNNTILVTGENGAGKTTALEAFYFGMTGKPFRKIKKEELINSTNKKDLLVEIEFEHDNHDYLVKRGIKPNVFELYRDGKLVDTDSSRKDYQKTLELLIGVDSDTFANTIFVSSKNYTPFLKLNTSDKRNFIENVLNIKIFSEMLEELKIKRTLIKERITELDYKIKNNQDKITIAIESNNKILNDKAERLESFKSILNENKVKLEETDNNLKVKKNEYELEKFEERIIKYNKLLNDVRNKYNILISENESERNILKLKENSLRTTLVNIEKNKTNDISTKSALFKADYEKIKIQKDNIKTKINEIKENNEFYSNNSICPTCHQPIDKCNDSIAEILKSNKDKIENYLNEIKHFDDEIELMKINFKSIKETIEDEYNKQKETVENELSLIDYSLIDNKLNELKNKLSSEENEIITNIDYNNKRKHEYDIEINDLISTIKNINSNIEYFNRQIEELENKKDIVIDISEFENELKINNEDKEKESYKFESLLELINILSDKGIKSYIIKKYIPTINELVNKYLEIFSAKYRISFDENFDIEIYAKGYEKLSYGSFSSGEEQRLDLSLLFAFYELGKLKKSINTNVIFFDEISDKSLDSDGINGLMNIFNTLKRNGRTVYNISHRIEMQDKFDKTIKVNKIKGFSNIE